MTETAPKPVGTEAPVPLDQVMLAMDVVDTLRHQQDLVTAELDEDRRQRDFVARVQSIYGSQGIEVSEAVIAEGVRALREDRFTYKPPERTLAVRFAEIYVERGRWARRAAVALLLVAAVWAAFVIPAHFRREGKIEGFRAQTEAAAQTAADLVQQAADLQTQVQRAAGNDADVAARLLTDAGTALQSARDRAGRVQTELTPLPDAAQYPDAPTQWDLRLQSHREALTAASADLGRARGLLDGVQQLRSLSGRLAAALGRLQGIHLSAAEQAGIDELQRSVQGAVERGDGAAGDQKLAQLESRIDGILAGRRQKAELGAALASLAAMLDGVEVEPAAAAERAELQRSIAQSLAAGDQERAKEQLASLRALVETLDSAYELRIVSQPDVQSGVWRESRDRPGTRNYYIIVEAVAQDRGTLRLPIQSEEDQRTRTVARFGIRVPERVYESVKADKLDNGIIDKKVFGQKRRGRREPEYRFEVAGGRITQW